MQGLTPMPLWFSNICAADLIHGPKIVYSEDSERHRLAYEQRFRCDLWLPLRSYSQALRAYLCVLDPGGPNRNVPQGAWQGGEVPASTFTQEEVGSNTTRNGEGILLRDTLAILMRSY
jgi:hypothetical protein